MVRSFHDVVRGFLAVVRCFHAVVSGFLAVVRGFHAVVKGFHNVVRSFHAVVRGFHAVVREFSRRGNRLSSREIRFAGSQRPRWEPCAVVGRHPHADALGGKGLPPYCKSLSLVPYLHVGNPVLEAQGP